MYARAAIAVLAGVALGLTWQPVGWWPLLAVSIPAFTLVVRDQRPRRAFGLGYLFGLAMLTRRDQLAARARHLGRRRC